MNRRIRGVGLALVLAAGVLSSAAQAQSIKIGVITDRVGPAKPYAEPVTDGIVFGASEINAKGGVLGRKIELQIEDDQGKPDVSATMARKLVEDGAVMILSVSLTPATQQAQTVTLATKTPQLTPSNSGDTLTTQIDNPYFWQTGPLGSTQIATLLSYARAKNYKRVALVSDNSDLGQLLAKFFRMGLEKAGIEVASEELIPRGATSADAQMQKVRAAKPQALVSAGVLTAENVLMLKSFRQLGINVPVLGSYNLSVPVYMSVAQGLMDGVTFVDAYDPDKAEIKQFVAAYKKGTGKDPYNLNGYGYDGIYLAADAIKRAGSADKEKIRAAMQATKGFHGVMGAKDSSYGFPEGKRTGFDPNGMVVRVYEGDKQGRVVHVGQK